MNGFAHQRSRRFNEGNALGGETARPGIRQVDRAEHPAMIVNRRVGQALVSGLKARQGRAVRGVGPQASREPTRAVAEERALAAHEFPVRGLLLAVEYADADAIVLTQAEAALFVKKPAAETGAGDI